LSTEMMNELSWVLDRISETPEVRAVVLSGQGKTFCAGADLKTRHGMRLFSHSRLRRMMLTGLRVDGDELYRLGIVEASVPADALMDRAMELARELASKSPLASVLAKQTLNAIEDMSLRDGYRYEQDMTAAIAKTEDAQEARRAFLEKRAPVFQGR